MANLKRLFVVVLTVAMIVTSMATAFAAPLTDVSGKKYEDAVNKLAGFGIAAGDNGQFKGESKLTRAEFATFIVKMLGLGEQSKVDTVFSDATSNDWYSGYVNVVTENGIMVGVGAGQFAPNKNVTYGEAITVFMKMLGYAPVVDGRGTWPNNYISRASNIKLTKDVSVTGSADVTRGNLGMMMWKAMTTNKLVESGTYDKDGNPEYQVAKTSTGAPDITKTLLYENFNEAVAADDTSVDPVAVKEVPLTSVNMDVSKVTLNIGAGKTFTVPAGVDANSLLGMDVYYVADKDDNMVWVKVATKPEKIVNDTVKEISSVAVTGGNAVDRIKLMTRDTSYLAASDMTLVYNGFKVPAIDVNAVIANIADAAFTVEKQDPARITVVLNDDSKIQTAIITQDVKNVGTANFTTQFGIVDSIDTIVKFEGISDLNFTDIQASGDSKSIKLVVTKDGKPAKLSDVKLNDFVRYTTIGTNTKIFNVFTPKIETVKIDSLEDTTNIGTVTAIAGDKRLKFGGACYLNQKTAVTDRGNLASGDLDKLYNFVGVEGTKVYYGPSGKVNFFENKVAVSDYKYAFVTKIDTTSESNIYDVTMYTSDETTVTYRTVENGIVNPGSTNPIDIATAKTTYRGQVVSYKLNKDNEITVLDNTKAKAITVISPNSTNATADEFIGYGAVGNPTKNYLKDAVILSWDKANYEKWTGTNGNPALSSSEKDDFTFKFTTTSWESLKNAAITDPTLMTNANTPAGSTPFAYVGANNNAAKFAVIRSNTMTSVVKYGIVVGSGYIDTSNTVKVNSKGVVTEYKVAETVYNAKGAIVGFSLNGTTATFMAGGVSDAVYDYNAVNGQLHYKVASGSGNDTYGRPQDYVSGKLTAATDSSRVITYKVFNPGSFNGDVTGNATGTFIKDNAEIYNITDPNNITYTTDITVLTKNTYFVYDRVANVILIIKGDQVYEKSQIGKQ